MGFWNRVRNQLAGAIQPAPAYTPKSKPINSVNLQDFKMQMTAGFSQPVWGPEITTVGAYSREGYTSRTYDMPVVPFSVQAYALSVDEDAQLAMNHLTSQVTGGEHYWKSSIEGLDDYMSKFSKQIDFDWIDTILVKEALFYGNSVWKPRLGIQNIRNKDDLMQIPISSFVRVWWDRQRRPYKYEFRGSEYQGYHNSDDIVHIIWNPVDASAFGVGFGASLCATREFSEITPSGPQQRKLPSLLHRKYSTQMTMHLTERRYIPHNVYQAKDASNEERAQLQSDLADLAPGEDVVVGSSVEVQELGSNQRSFDPTKFTDTVLGPIYKALNNFRGKQGEESSHQYANAKTAAVLDEIGLTSFPLAITRQLQDKIFKPWYESNQTYNPATHGWVGVPWDDAGYELNFGRVEKRDLTPDVAVKLLEIGLKSGALPDPSEVRQILEDNGLGLRKEYTQNFKELFGPMNPMPPAQQPMDWNTSGADLAPRPQDDFSFNSSMLAFDPQPSDPHLNFTDAKKYPKKLDFD